ncbi:hypothetical protein GZH46_00792, partial [Fragariocoptes setiger]
SLDNIIEAANHISSMGDQPEFYVSINVSLDLLTKSKQARCEALYTILDTTYHEVRESSMNRSRTLIISDLHMTYAGKSAPLIDFIDAAWITSKFHYEQARSITDHMIDYLENLKSKSRARSLDTRENFTNPTISCSRYMSASEFLVSLAPRIWYDIRARWDDFWLELHSRFQETSPQIKASIGQIIDVFSEEVVRPSVRKLRLPIQDNNPEFTNKTQNMSRKQ